MKGNRKNQEVGLPQTKKLLHREGNNQQNKKAIYNMGKYIFKPCV